jgi:hypothetical protein
VGKQGAMAMVVSKLFTRKGNCAGFTATGASVVGYYHRAVGCWTVETQAENDRGPSVHLTRESFPDAQSADAYALSLIDTAKTEELKWWN